MKKQYVAVRGMYFEFLSKGRENTLFTWAPFVIMMCSICALLWGSAFPCLKIGFAMMGIENSVSGKLYFAGTRFFIAGFFMLLWIRATGKKILLPTIKDYFIVMILGLFQNAIQYFFFYIGISNTTGVKAAIISGAGSFFLAFLSPFFFKNDRLSPIKTMGLILGFCGIIIVNFDKDSLDFSFRFLGEGFIVLATLSSTFGILLVKKFSLEIFPPLLAGYQLVSGSVIMLVCALFLEPPHNIVISGEATALTLYLSFVSAAAFSLWYSLIKYNQLTKIAVYRFLIPVFAAFESALLLAEETIAVNAMAALFLVSVGIILTSREPDKTLPELFRLPKP